jgi:ArsR family transcriptional regulator, arsenate/arsenite/antimonite-responsive transcriptional repressor
MTSRMASAARALPELLSPVFFKALCDPNRIALLAWLAMEREPRTVTEVSNAGCCAVDVSVVSRHLATLRDAGLVKAEKRGKEVFYRVEVQTIADRLRQIAAALESCCGVAKPR